MFSSRVSATKTSDPALLPPPSRLSAQARTATARTQHRSAPGCFDNLPHEIVCGIAGHVFQAAVYDERNTVSSLACTPLLRAVLSDELHAGKVLERIHAARDFPALTSALAEVRSVFPTYRQGCLVAAARLMPKLSPRGPEADALVSRIQSLLPHLPARQAGPGGGDEDPRDAVLLALVEGSRLTPSHLVPVARFEKILGLVDPGAPLGPRLEAALLRQVVDHLRNPVFDLTVSLQRRQRWLSLAPPAMQARLTRVFDFFESVQAAKSSSSAGTIARQMKEIETAHAAGDPDAAWQLRRASRTWCTLARRLPECGLLYRAFFDQLDPARQLLLVQWGQSPLRQGEIERYLASRIGQVPGTTLLQAIANYDVPGSDMKDSVCRTDLLRSITRSAIDTPQQDEVLGAAISSAHISFRPLFSFFEQRVAQADEKLQPALKLRLALADVGCGEFSYDLAARRAPVSRMVDNLLDSSRPLDSNAVVTLVELRIAWLDKAQCGRLLERIRQLPPVDSARCLTIVLSDLANSRSAKRWPPSKLMVDVCAALPPEHRTRPVAALLEMVSKVHGDAPQEDITLLQGTRRLYDALPTTLLPPFNGRHDKVLRQAREQAPA